MNKSSASSIGAAMSDLPSSPSRLVHWLSLCALGGSSLLAASHANAEPGVPQAPTVIFTEDFQNGPPANGTLLDGYTGATGQTYTADNAWLTHCNGLLSSANLPVAQSANCDGSQLNWNATQQLSQALGTYTNQATPASNFAVSAYTSANPGAGLVEFATVNPIALQSGGRFVASAVDVAAMNCGVSAPSLQFALVAGGSSIPAGGPINACASPTTVSMAALGSAGAATANVGTYRSGSALISAAAVDISMTNANGSGAGNDHAFDNIQLLDVTPTLDKSFSPTQLAAGKPSTLTFTITNTSELGAKAGWSFTDHLPAGLVVATPPAVGNAGTACPNVAVTAGGNSIAVSGDLSDGMTACTVTVTVTSNGGGAYQNGPGNIQSSGLNPPQISSVTFSAPAPVPADASWAMLLLSSLLAGFAGLRLRNRGHRG